MNANKQDKVKKILNEISSKNGLTLDEETKLRENLIANSGVHPFKPFLYKKSIYKVHSVLHSGSSINKIACVRYSKKRNNFTDAIKLLKPYPNEVIVIEDLGEAVKTYL